ncbi:MAG: hypothetical protein AAFY45_26175 [Bacteroidota bacterium]
MKQSFTLLLLTFGLACSLFAQLPTKSDLPDQGELPLVPDLFGYQDYDTRIFKLNVLDLVQFTNPDGIIGKIQFAYEHKLKPSWSLNTELSANYFFAYREFGKSNLKLRDGILSLTLEPRFYLGMQRRMFFKQSKNNFSSNYVSLAFSTRLIELNRGFSATDNSRYLYSDNFGIAPLFGVQRRILKWIFVDFNLGIRVSYGDPLRTRLFFPKDSGKVWQIAPHTTLKLGLAI